MSLDAVSLQVLLQWQQSRANTGSGDTQQEGSVDTDLAGIDVAEWDELYHEVHTLEASNSEVVIDLTVMDNYVDVPLFAFARVLVLYVKNLGDEAGAGDAVVVVSPGDTDPILWLHGDAADYGTPLPVGTFVALGGAPTGTGEPVGSTNRNLKITLVSGAEAFVEVAVLGSTLTTG